MFRLFSAIFGIIVLAISVGAQSTTSSQTVKQKVAVVVPSDTVDESVSLIEGKVVVVYDGDNIGIEGKDYKFYSIRINGIDAPEEGQDHGKEARKKLVDLIEGKDVRVVVIKKGVFDRYMGNVYLDGADVGLLLIKSGNAWHFKQIGYEQNAEDRKKYTQAEKKARADKVGLWAKNAPIPPWEFRGDESSEKAIVAPAKQASTTAVSLKSASNESRAPVQDKTTGRTYTLGPRGGCYYMSDSGSKVYVKDKSLCGKQQ